MNNKKIAIIAILIILMSSIVVAITVNVLAPIKISQSSRSVEVSTVTVDSIELIDNKMITSLDVSLNNTDTINHIVSVDVSVYDINSTEISSGSKVGITVLAGTVNSVTINILPKPALVDISNMYATVTEV